MYCLEDDDKMFSSFFFSESFQLVVGWIVDIEVMNTEGLSLLRTVRLMEEVKELGK